jgi:hypothetical protein
MDRRVRADAYVYIVYRPDGRPCYVGKGTGGRWERHDRRDRNPHFFAIRQKHGKNLPTFKFKTGLTDEDALALEVRLIAIIGRETHGGPLVNMTDGGEGARSHKPSAEWLKRRSEAAREVWKRPEFRAAQIERMRGNSHSKKPHTLSPEWKSELTEKMRGNSHTKGTKHSPEARLKMKSKWDDPAYREKMMASRRAKGMYTPEWMAALNARRLEGRK